MAQSLPAEIHAHIFQYLPSRDFVTLARVSQKFLKEADRLLYRDVVLIHFKALKCWSQTLLAHPDLGLRVHSLIMHLPPSSIFDTQHQINLSRALKACPNIQDLRILPVESSRRFGNEATGTYFLQNCSFRLKKFTNSHFQPSVLFDFLASQTNITFLSMSASTSWALPINILPSLLDLEVGACIDIIGASRRRIEHLRVNLHLYSSHYPVKKEIFHAFKDLSPTLTSLTIAKGLMRLNDTWPGVEMALDSLDYLHQLKYLNIFHDHVRETINLIEAWPNLLHSGHPRVLKRCWQPYA